MYNVLGGYTLEGVAVKLERWEMWFKRVLTAAILLSLLYLSHKVGYTSGYNAGIEAAVKYMSQETTSS